MKSKLFFRLESWLDLYLWMPTLKIIKLAILNNFHTSLKNHLIASRRHIRIRRSCENSHVCNLPRVNGVKRRIESAHKLKLNKNCPSASKKKRINKREKRKSDAGVIKNASGVRARLFANSYQFALSLGYSFDFQIKICNSFMLRALNGGISLHKFLMIVKHSLLRSKSCTVSKLHLQNLKKY